MIKYKTSDLVKKATQLADLENTDFISWNENQTLLNDAYQTVMQRYIDAGEQLNIKTIYSTTGQSIPLPDDFYSLRSVTLYYNGMISMVPRHTISMSYHDLSYEIRNNTLYLYGGQSQKVKIDYYVSFPTIGYPNDDAIISYTKASTYLVVQVNSDYVVEYSWDSTHTYKVYDINTHTLLATTSQEQSEVLLHGTYLCLKTSAQWNIFSITTSAYLTIPTSSILVIDANGDLCYANDSIVYDINGLQVGELTNTYPTTTTCIYIDVSKGKEIAYLSENANEIVSLVLNGKTYTTQIGFVALNTDALYFIIDRTLYKYDLNDNIISSIKTFNLNLISFTGLNGSTGYGVAALNDSTSLRIFSYLVDTKLSLPNNTLWNIIAYQLAIQYKVKQGADITLLSSTYTTMSNTFFDSLRQDMYQPCRINNIYK